MEKNIMDTSIFLDFDVDTDRCERLREEITSGKLEDIVDSFTQSANNLIWTISLPEAFMMAGGVGIEEIYFLILARIVLKSRGVPDEKHTQEMIDKEASTIREIARNDQNGGEFNKHSAKHVLDRLVEVEQMARCLRALTYSVLANAWTTFECAAKDTWVTALNALPIPLGHSAITSIEEAEDGIELSRKYISVGYAAKYGFDLRNHLGTILERKFNFNCVKGIHHAYKAAFGDNKSLSKIFNSTALTHLEAARHLIVHRAGRIDEEYRQKVGVSIPIGEFLPLDVQNVNDLVNIALDTSIGLIKYVDKWLATTEHRSNA